MRPLCVSLIHLHVPTISLQFRPGVNTVKARGVRCMCGGFSYLDSTALPCANDMGQLASSLYYHVARSLRWFGSVGPLRRQGQGLIRAEDGVDNVEQVLGEGVNVLETGTAHLADVLELGLDGAIGLEGDGVVDIVVAARDRDGLRANLRLNVHEALGRELQDACELGHLRGMLLANVAELEGLGDDLGLLSGCGVVVGGGGG